jgi:hypothetical protein
MCIAWKLISNSSVYISLVTYCPNAYYNKVVGAAGWHVISSEFLLAEPMSAYPATGLEDDGKIGEVRNQTTVFIPMISQMEL